MHSIHVHPSSADLIYAPTGGGFYRSNDGGDSWTLVYDCYARAAWLDPRDPQHVMLGPADGVEADGRIEETHDGGQTWLAASKGLRVPWRQHMVERFVPYGDYLFALLSNGELLEALFSTLEWRPILREVADIRALTAIEG